MKIKYYKIVRNVVEEYYVEATSKKKAQRLICELGNPSTVTMISEKVIEVEMIEHDKRCKYLSMANYLRDASEKEQKR
jgi:hypothetical protein